MLFAPALGMVASLQPWARRLPGGGGQGGRDGHGPFVASASAGAPLAALAGGALARRFYRWSGRSGARYVVTVRSRSNVDWLEIEGAVVLIVAVDLDGGRRLVAVEADPCAGRRREIGQTLSHGAQGGGRFEAHLHLLAETPAARRRVADDLAAMIAPIR